MRIGRQQEIEVAVCIGCAIVLWGVFSLADEPLYPPEPAAIVTGSEHSGWGNAAADSAVRVAQVPPPITPSIRPADRINTPAGSSGSQRATTPPSEMRSLPSSLFNRRSSTDEFSLHRQRIADIPGADTVFGIEAFMRAATKSDDLLSRSQSAIGISAQKRTPLSTDLRIRGSRSGQLLASGSYWAPARADLDTMMNKIDSSIVQDMIVVKGPFSVRYGPGFGFVDMQFIQSPRHENGYQWDGATRLTYKSNGEQWFGRQTLTGGAENWGYFVSYGHSTGTDYEDGLGIPVPASFKSRDLFASVGHDIDESKSFEFTYLRLDQTDVEYPGLVFDMDYLVTDGFELTYENDLPIFGDHFRAEGWHNRTHFKGDTLGQGKAFQIPELTTILFSPSGDRGYGVTDVDAASTGYRFAWDVHLSPEETVTVGTDMIHLDTELNDIEPLLPPDDNNFPIPASYSNDAGLFVEHYADYSPVRLTSGARVDFVNTHAVRRVRGVPVDLEEFKNGDLDQQFTLWSAFMMAERDLDDHWTANVGVGFGERPLTLTELYATASFIGLLQRGLTSVNGDVELDPERMRQITVGLEGDYENARMGFHAFHSWIKDYVAYDLISLPGEFDEALATAVQFTNTDLATLAGFEGYSELDLLERVTAFGSISYIEGRDRSRNTPSRDSTVPRSGLAGRPHEPLPGIAPLEAFLGFRLHDDSVDQLWGFEFYARLVGNQDRIAASLEEIETPGFVTFDTRSYWRLTEDLLFIAGIENLTDEFYREHLDYRSGLGVFRPGINFYFGTELGY